MIRTVSSKDPESIRFELGLYCLFNDTQRDLLFNVIMGICRRAGCEYGGLHARYGFWNIKFYNPEHPRRDVNVYFYRKGKSSIEISVCCDTETRSHHTLYYYANPIQRNINFGKTDPLFRLKIRFFSNWIKTTLKRVDYQWSMPDYKAQFILGIICMELENAHGITTNRYSSEKMMFCDKLNCFIQYINSFFLGPGFVIGLECDRGSVRFYYKDSPNKIRRRVKKLAKMIKNEVSLL